MPVPMLDFRRDNDVESERSVADWSGVRDRLQKNGDTAASLAFRDGLPENAVNFMLARLPEMSVEKRDYTKGTGFAPLDVVLSRHGHANPITSTAVVDPQSATEEVIHLAESQGGVPLTQRQDYKDAVHKGTLRMSEAYMRPMTRDGKFILMAPVNPRNRRMSQLLREDPQSAHYRPGCFWGSHGKAYEFANAALDREHNIDTAAMNESLPAILELPKDTADKYYPEAMDVINEYLDGVPLYEGDYTTKR